MLLEGPWRKRTSRVELGFAAQDGEDGGGANVRQMPPVEEVVPGKKGLVPFLTYPPMQQPKRPHVLQEWIVPVLAKNGVAEPRRLVPDTLRRPSNSGHLRPEPDGAHHVLADAQNHHGTLVVGERGRIAHEGSMRLRQPRIANWKRLVPRKPHSVSSIPSRWGRRSRPSPAAPRVRHAKSFPPPARSLLRS